MAENNLNVIKPVQGPQGLTSVEWHKEGKEREQRQNNESEDQHKAQTEEDMIEKDEIVKDSSDIHTVDYRA